MKTKVVLMPVAQVRVDGGTQSRAATREDVIEEYAEAYAAGTEMPPIVVFLEDETRSHWLADGFHRLAAAQRAACTKIRAEIRPGTQRDALLFSVGANGNHGLRRTREDKRRAVEMLLRDAAWGARSDRWIADAAHVHHETVAAARRELAVSPVASRQGRDGKARKVPEAEAGGDEAASEYAESPVNAVREAHETPRDAGGGTLGEPAEVPTSDGAQPGEGAVREPPSASPANVSPDPRIDMRGLSASDEWLKSVGALVTDLRWSAGIAKTLKTAIGRIDPASLHERSLARIRTAVAEAINALEQVEPVSTCKACDDPDGSAGRRETCSACLGFGYATAGQAAPVIAPKRPAVPRRPEPPWSARRRGLRIELDQPDGTSVPFEDVPSASDDDDLEPVL